MKTTKRAVLGLVSFGLVSGLTIAPAFADAPNGNYVPNPNQNSQGNCVAVFSAQIIQNGQFVSQQAQSGQRSSLVHQAQSATC